MTERPLGEPPPRQRRASIPKNLKGPKGIAHQPVSGVRWVPRELVQANDYNPNVVAPPEMRLLKISILTDGWTQPLVVRSSDDGEFFELIDGYHRWLASEDKRILDMTKGQVPVALVNHPRHEDRVMSTIRHNRARGNHAVLKMADLSVGLLGELESLELQDLLQMEEEEVNRLRARGKMTERAAGEGFSNGWQPQ